MARKTRRVKMKFFNCVWFSLLILIVFNLLSRSNTKQNKRNFYPSIYLSNPCFIYYSSVIKLQLLHPTPLTKSFVLETYPLVEEFGVLLPHVILKFPSGFSFLMTTPLNLDISNRLGPELFLFSVQNLHRILWNSKIRL